MNMGRNTVEASGWKSAYPCLRVLREGLQRTPKLNLGHLLCEMSAGIPVFLGGCGNLVRSPGHTGGPSGNSQGLSAQRPACAFACPDYKTLLAPRGRKRQVASVSSACAPEPAGPGRARGESAQPAAHQARWTLVPGSVPRERSKPWYVH